MSRVAWMARALSRQPSFITDMVVLIAILLAGTLLWTLAYQVPRRLDLAIGGDNVTHRRWDEAPFLRNFNAPEPASANPRVEWWTLSPGFAYRWTQDDSTIDIPGLGSGRWLLTVRAGSGRPENAAAVSSWQVNAREPVPIVIVAGDRYYHLPVEASATGDLTLRMRTDPHVTAADPRNLGFVLREVQLTPLNSGLRPPASAQIAWLALTVALIYAMLRWMYIARPWAVLIASASVLVSASLLATYPFILTVFTPTLAALAAGCAAIVLVCRVGFWAMSRGSADNQSRLRIAHSQFAILALVVLAFALRLGGMLNPYARFSDHVFNANNLFKVSLGIVHLTAGLPEEAGGGDAPYPPGMYLLQLPAQLFFPANTAARVLLVQSSVALLDSLVAALIWWLLRRVGLGRRAALFGAALYLLPPPLLESFSVGEYANIGGQFLALPALALLALKQAERGTTDGQENKQWFWYWLPLLCIGLLGHLGVTMSLISLLGSVWLVGMGSAVTQRRAMRTTPPLFAPGRIALGGAGALLAVVLIYYSAPPYLAILGERLAAEATITAANNSSAQAVLADQILSFLGLMRPEGRAPLPTLLVCSYLVGLALLWSRRPQSDEQYRLGALLTAWGLGVLLLQAFLLVFIARQGVRWPHFIYPALCLGAGPALAMLWRRGGSGKLVVGAVLAAVLIFGLDFWIVQIRDYHP